MIRLFALSFPYALAIMFIRRSCPPLVVGCSSRIAVTGFPCRSTISPNSTILLSYCLDFNIATGFSSILGTCLIVSFVMVLCLFKIFKILSPRQIIFLGSIPMLCNTAEVVPTWNVLLPSPFHCSISSAKLSLMLYAVPSRLLTPSRLSSSSTVSMAASYSSSVISPCSSARRSFPLASCKSAYASAPFAWSLCCSLPLSCSALA